MKTMSKQEWLELCQKHTYSWETSFNVRWCLGGSYGNCWNDQMQHVSADDPEELESLDNFIEAEFPEISFLQYRKVQKCVKNETTCEGDYYGGSTEYQKIEITFSDLARVLVECELLEIE